MELQTTKQHGDDREDELLAVAKLLIHLSRSSAIKSWPPEKKESASPTTPLSWSNRSGSSGGLCEDDWTASSSSPKRRRKSIFQRGDQSPDPSAEPNQVRYFPSAFSDRVETLKFLL